MQVTRQDKIRRTGVRLHPKACAALGLEAERATPKRLGTLVPRTPKEGDVRKHGGTPSQRDKHVTLAAISPPGVARGHFVGGQQSGVAGCKPPPLFTRGASFCLSQGRRRREPWGASPRPSAPTYLPCPRMFQSGGRLPLLLVQARMRPSGASGRHLSSDVPARGLAAPAACSAPDVPVRGVSCLLPPPFVVVSLGPLLLVLPLMIHCWALLVFVCSWLLVLSLVLVTPTLHLLGLLFVAAPLLLLSLVPAVAPPHPPVLVH